MGFSLVKMKRLVHLEGSAQSMDEYCVRKPNVSGHSNVVKPIDLLERAEARRALTLQTLDVENQAARGQFFTPLLAANIIAALPRLPKTGTFRILDPGAGSGILSAAMAARIQRECPDLVFEFTAVENDSLLRDALESTLRDIESKTGASTRTVPTDFLQWALATDERFDLVIQNPPYAKLATKSHEQQLLRGNGIMVPNIYAAFMALGIHLLKPGGQQVSITPRSWMNGAYYHVFRNKFTHSAGIDSIHTFESRSKVFGDMGVLQESVIVSATKGEFPEQVTIYTSHDHISKPFTRTVEYGDVVTPDFVHVPATKEDAEAVAWMRKNVRCTLKELGLTVSTGRVVDFRSRENLRTEPGGGAVPLLHATHLRGGSVYHPIHSKKPEWFSADSEQTRKMLVGGGTYVLIKRFSAKEERRRVVAGVWKSHNSAAFDNKLNFIHDGGAGLDPEIATGLGIFLNSTQTDRYFRVFSGHTQVNATDLRQMRFPTENQLRALAQSDIDGQGSIDAAVEAVVSAQEVSA